MHCRKLNFVLIDFEVGLLLTFLASMKAKVCLYQNYVSVLGVYTCRFQVSVFKVSSLVSGFKSLHFACAFSSFVCKRKAKTVTKCSFLCWKRSCVNAASDNRWIHLHVDDRWFSLNIKPLSLMAETCLTVSHNWYDTKNTKIKPGMHVWCRRQCTYGATSVVIFEQCVCIAYCACAHTKARVLQLASCVCFSTRSCLIHHGQGEFARATCRKET